MSLEPYDDGKAAFFKELETMRPDLMYPEGWTDEQRAEAVELLRPTRVKTSMLTSIPMTCQAEQCPMAPSCPLLKQNLAPKGSPCPIEASAVHQFFSDYVEELGVDVTRMVEVSMVRDLVDQEIQQLRKTWILSQEHFIQENVVGVDMQGNVVTKKELHQAVDYEERILKRKEKIRNALLATRESKAKIGQSQTDGATVIANILEDVRKIEQARQKELRAKLGLGEFDEYIDVEPEDDEAPVDGE